LKGGRFAFVDPDSASGRLAPLLWLKKQGVDLKTHFAETFYAGGHKQAFEALLSGSAEVCACGDFLYESALRDKRPGVEDLVVLYRSETLPHECVIARGDLPEPVFKAVSDTLFALNGKEPENAAILAGMGYDRVAESLDSAYDPIRKIARALLAREGKDAKDDKAGK
jgi:ABC-type phosphate/phosphonate transport system substrate-binding protein